MVVADSRYEPPGGVENVRFEISGDQVIIDYDLFGSTDEEYAVQVLVKRTSDASFEYRPLNVSGDVGEGVLSGMAKRAIWNLKEEFPQGLEGDDYYLLVSVRTMDSGTPLLLWVGAGVVAAGGIATLLLLSNQSAGEEPVATGFPSPPGRP
jgi:hypothetical protein